MIDCDVHVNWESARVLLPYVEPVFRDYLERGEGGGDDFPVATRGWRHPEGYMRADAIPGDGRVPGADYDLLCEQLLDRFEVDYGVLTGDVAIEVSTLGNPYYASALARAANDWLAAEWLSRDDRLLGSIFVAPQDPKGAAEEIRRVAGTHERFCQVLLASVSRMPYGEAFYHPIWDAAAEVDIPIAIHFGGTAGANSNGTACGHPTYYWEYHATACEAGISQLASVIAHGIFEQFPNVSLVLTELGTAWLAGVLWRLDQDYKALRKETPWLKMLPSEYAHERVRVTTQPMEDPKDKRQLHHVLEAAHGRDVLMFASDYPHWDFDDPGALPIPPAWRDAVFDGNARRLYGLPARPRATDTSAAV